MEPAPAKVNPKDKLKATKSLMKQKMEGKKGNYPTYQVVAEIGNGVSSSVFQAINLVNGEKVALKKIKKFLQNKHQSLRILREILLLKKLKHPNIINLKEIILEGQDPKNLSLVLEYLPTDVKKLFKSNLVFSFNQIKRIIYQILLGLQYCQQCQVLHRDLKPQNVLVTKDLKSVKLCDFGLARAVLLEGQKDEMVEQNSMKSEDQEKKKHQNHHMQPSNANLTAHVSTRWYRAPELIILQRKYSNAIDIWSVGCILGQLMTMTQQFTQRKPLFPGKACYPLSPPKTAELNYKKVNDFPHSAHDQLSVIFSILGTPTDIDFISDERAKHYIKSFGFKPRKPFNQIFKHITPQAEDFLLHSFEFNPLKRMTIAQAINHKLFDDIRADYVQNTQIKGEPISMELDGIDIPQIRQMVLQQYKEYQIQRQNGLI